MTVHARKPAGLSVTALGAATSLYEFDNKARAGHKQREQCDQSNDREPGGENQDQPDQGSGNREVNH